MAEHNVRPPVTFDGEYLAAILVELQEQNVAVAAIRRNVRAIRDEIVGGREAVAINNLTVTSDLKEPLDTRAELREPEAPEPPAKKPVPKASTKPAKPAKRPKPKR